MYGEIRGGVWSQCSHCERDVQIFFLNISVMAQMVKNLPAV